MRQYPRIRRLAKWFGLVTCALISAGWALSYLRPGCLWESLWAHGSWIWLRPGAASFNTCTTFSIYPPMHGIDLLGFSVMYGSHTGWIDASTMWRARVPFWLALMVAAIPTALLWW